MILEALKKELISYNKRTIELAQLETLLTPHVNSYEQFARIVRQLEEEDVLNMVKSTGRTSRRPSLALQYRINKSALVEGYHHELQHYRHHLHAALNIDTYYRRDPSVWKDDLPFITKIDQHLKTYGFPIESVPAPERSFELVGDEKWIVEKGGKEVLERLGIYRRLNIIPVSEPLMFAINPSTITAKTQFHLIVENKTTYQALLPALEKTNFSTLIYGHGKTIIKSIELFPFQYPIDANHHFLYFGDIDREGIWIWYRLAQTQPVLLALPFYEACLKTAPAEGKGYQREHKEALDAFLSAFTQGDRMTIERLLTEGQYYPQETLKTRDLQQIWRESDWKTLILKP